LEPPHAHAGRARRWPAFVLTLGAMAGARLAVADGPDFDRTVAPILARRCLDCHAGAEPKGKLDLSRRDRAREGGENGPAVVPGNPEESLLWERVDGDEMPPKKPLPAPEKAVLKAWIAAGAAWGTDPIDPLGTTTDRRAGRDWWAFQPVRRPPLPPVRDTSRVANPVDAFILEALDARGLALSPPAGRQELVRRLTFDLTGLPPTPEEAEAFALDDRPDACERLVDRLLASPGYGVRWGRLWLDLARFGESNGFEFDEFRPNAWPYRDWVVDALNRNTPYDEFVRLQLAGDVLRPGDLSAVEATGFLVAGAYDTVGQDQQSLAMRKVVRQDELEDLVGTVGQSFLGLTVHCARCHDHKFDPIRQSEYYGLAAALAGVRRGERDLSAIDPAVAPLRERLAGLSEQLEAIEKPVRERLQSAGPITLAAISAALEQGTRAEHARRRAEVEALKKELAARGRRAFVVTPRPPDLTFLLIRGNTATPGARVAPGGVATLSGLDPGFGLPPDAPDADRRARLAEWVVHPNNPLTARVIVNRVWQAHFGAGLVETPSDLGFNGGRPSHTELLDWLASEFVARGWDLKRLHRLIVTSAAYRQSSRPNPAAARVDAANRLLWRKTPRRLDAEMVRDAMLDASGALDPAMGGPGFREFVADRAPGTAAMIYKPAEPAGPRPDRRTLYRTWARGGRNGFLDAFDCPDPSTASPRRAVTTTPLQALALLNNALALRLADRFADRLRREAGDDPGRQAERAYRLALGRPPDAAELAEASRVVSAHGTAALARALFNSNEFLYVD
jgi:hypothetical protein